MVLLTKGDYIWIAPQCRGEFSIPIGAQILEVKADSYIVEDDDGKQYSLRTDSDIQVMHPSSIRSIADMTALGELHECSILRNLFLRYRENEIYTYTGSILIAINPYRSLSIYTEKMMRQYTNKDIGAMPPHLFAIGDNAFRNMLRNARDQCIIISGESGAGKTESTKLLLQFITTLSGGDSCIGKRILDSNPIMEAFGNAKTVRNDNSSRFGKYVDIHFDRESGRIVSARIEQYLLEKSRIVRQAPGERNYHAFYCMLAGMPLRDRRRLGLKEARCYNYLCQDRDTAIDSPNDATHFANIVSTMQYLKFTDTHIEEIWNLLAAILHLGNISFCETLMESADASKVKDTHRSELRYASNLLGMSPACLEKAMTTRRIQMAGECVVAQFLPASACTVRDAFVKTIYDHLFRWIVEKINAAIYKPPVLESAAVTPSGTVVVTPRTPTVSPMRSNGGCQPSSCRLPTPVDRSMQACSGRAARANTWPTAPDVLASPTFGVTATSSGAVSGVGSSPHELGAPPPPQDSTAGLGRLSIGVLDIFGFENFVSNSFEQLCINYANENIQQYFVRHIFKLEQEEYLTEGINWKHIDFRDNQEVLDLIAHQPLNVLALVDEESRFPRGSDESFLNKLNARHSNTSNFIKTLSSAENRFGIVHFAGPVYYNVDGFLEKNRDTFNHDLLDVINTSKNDFLRKLFEKRLHTTDGRSRSLTLGMQFKKSLERLMSIINGCQPFFVRCIKPNEFKMPNCFDRNLCVRQLRYSGMMETIQIRSLGYPIRYEFADFVARFHMVLHASGTVGGVARAKQLRSTDPQHVATEICRAALGPDDATYAIGASKVFLRSSQDSKLEELRDKVIQKSAIIIQSQWRAYIVRRKYQELRKYTIICQRRFRQLAAKRKFLRVRYLIMRMQANVRARQARRRFVAKVLFIVSIQVLSRAWLAKQTVINLMRKRGFFTAEMALQYQNEDTQVCICESEVPEDTMLANAVSANWGSSVTPTNILRVTCPTASAPEFCLVPKTSTPLEANPFQPTTLGRSEESDSDMNYFVDTLFEPVFSSVNLRQDNLEKGDSLDVKEEQCLNSTNAMAGHKAFQQSIASRGHHAALAMDSGGGEVVWSGGSRRFKARSNPTVLPVAGAASSQKPAALSPSLQGRCSSEAAEEAAEEAEVMSGRSAGTIAALADTELTSWRECSFLQFAAAHFQTGVLPTYSSGPLPRSLLKHASKSDSNLALQIFNKISKFMKYKKDANDSRTGDHEVLVNVSGSLPFSDVTESDTVTIQSGCRVDLALTDGDIGNTTSRTGTSQDPEPILVELRQIRFIVGTGINHPQMRDEIFCQILKQITKNPSSYSRNRGWILLGLCASCFTPCQFDTALRMYLKSSSCDCAKTCLRRLSRIHQTGPRSMPPSYMEVRAEKEHKTLGVHFRCPTGSRVRVKVDPTVTVEDFNAMALTAACIKDTFGFEVFISIFDKVVPLSAGPKHLFDNISLCEEFTKSKGLSETDLPWSFCIRKTIFAPWHDVTYDPVATSHISFQVVQQCFEEPLDSLEDHELAYLLANIFRLHSTDGCHSKMPESGSLHDWLAQILSPDGDIAFWTSVTNTALTELTARNPEASTSSIRENIATFAKLQWTSNFCRDFKAVLLLPDKSPTQDVTISVDCTGVQVYDEKRALINSIAFIEMHYATANVVGRESSKVLLIKTVFMQEHRFLCDRAVDLKDLISYMLVGLRQRSRYAIAMKKVSNSDCSGGSFMQVNPGDYILMHQMGWELDPKVPIVGRPSPSMSAPLSPQQQREKTTYCYGENQRTWEKGRVAVSAIYILPTMTAPKPEFIHAFAHLVISNENREWLNLVEGIKTQRSRRPAARLQKKTLNHSDFLARDTRSPRSQDDSQLSDAVTLQKSAHSVDSPAFKHTRLPLRRPFVKELVNGDRKIFDAALLSFCLIQNYMGDCDKVPSQLKNMPIIFVTDLLFGTALDCPPLRDEFYLQLMNQLTDNPRRASESRGFELMWLATGIMTPSQEVRSVLMNFLHRSPHSLASQCYSRLHHTVSRGLRRKPPHALEVAAIRGKKEKITQKIILPNEAFTTTVLESTTTAADVIQKVVQELNLPSNNQLGLYVPIDEELRCIKPEEFIFDALRVTMPDVQLQMSQKGIVTSSPPIPLYLRRKLWLNVVPGKHITEDRLINFPQAVDDFLLGHYNCSLERALELGTLVFIWRTDETPGSQTSLDQILPRTMLHRVTDAQWLSVLKLTSVVNANRRLSRADIPTAFLNNLFLDPNFGSSFFCVQSDATKKVWLLSVNSSQVVLLDNKSENELWRHNIEEVVECWQDGVALNLQFLKASCVTKLLSSETSAHNACDLINCYMRQHKLEKLP